MDRIFQRLVGVVVIAGLPLAACGGLAAGGAGSEMQSGSQATRPGQSGPSRITLTKAEGERLVIEMGTVRQVRGEASGAGEVTERKVVPYAAVIYDGQGDTWVYTSPEPLTFVRQAITVDYIDGDAAFLSGGPPPGTRVVTAGAAELYGVEF